MEGEREDLRKKLYTYSGPTRRELRVRCVCVSGGRERGSEEELYTYSVKSNKTFDMSYDYMAVFVRCVCVGGE